MVRVDVVAAAWADILQLHARMLIGPDAVVAVLGALLNTSPCDGLLGFSRRGGSVVHLPRQCLLHSLLFTLLDVQKFIRHRLAVVFLICGLSEPDWQLFLEGTGH